MLRLVLVALPVFALASCGGGGGGSRGAFDFDGEWHVTETTDGISASVVLSFQQVGTEITGSVAGSESGGCRATELLTGVAGPTQLLATILTPYGGSFQTTFTVIDLDHISGIGLIDGCGTQMPVATYTRGPCVGCDDARSRSTSTRVILYDAHGNRLASGFVPR